MIKSGGLRARPPAAQIRPLSLARRFANVFPTTHAMRIVHGILLKGNGWSDIAPDIWPVALLTLIVTVFAAWY